MGGEGEGGMGGEVDGLGGEGEGGSNSEHVLAIFSFV